MTAQAAQQHWAVKWGMGIAQTLAVSFICWLGSGIASSVGDFSKKLDGVVASIAAIAQEQVLAKREAVETNQRLSKVADDTEALKQRVSRLEWESEQKGRTNGR
ncbi:hypothetical protein ACIPL1_27630 [Pseudomonas sp. NPDC090202]|uniref:hypothetical protein n=1 Tax=unclassified Pseudomonas TaxID=196821 RepID=UPI0038266CA6